MGMSRANQKSPAESDGLNEAGTESPGMVVDHVGIVVKSIPEGVEHWRVVFGYQPLTEVVTNTRQKVRVIFLRKEQSIDIKLLEPSDATSPIYAFAMRGGGLHHLCMRVGSLESELARLNALGLRTLCPPEPGEAFGDELIAFVYAKHGLSIELIATDKKAKRLPR
jgi:methylmalonyl-CoA/ethylmalonyl-CoA epimerase